jgi:hypothetical protein
MRESYIEGVANHSDPESCAVVRKGGSEALTGVGAGRVLSREINSTRMPTQFSNAEGNMLGGVTASLQAIRRGRRPLARAETPCTRTGRAYRLPSQMARWDVSGSPRT